MASGTTSFFEVVPIFSDGDCSCRVFGLKGVLSIRLLFGAILRHLCYNFKKLVGKTRYVETEDC